MSESWVPKSYLQTHAVKAHFSNNFPGLNRAIIKELIFFRISQEREWNWSKKAKVVGRFTFQIFQ